MNRFKNVLVGSAVSVLMFTLAVPPASAQSSTMINLQAQIAALTAQIVAMTGGVTNQAEYVASDKIITTSAVRVRTIGSLNGVVLGSQRNGSLGTIVAGPVRASNNTWYRINFDVGIDGWVAAANFERNGLQNKPEVGFSRSGSDLEKLLALATEAPQVRYDLPKTKTAFVQYLYRCVLDRTPDQEGLARWTALTSPAPALYKSFFNSPEFNKKNLNNPQFVDKLYQCVLFREAEQAGKNGWVARLAAGDSRLSVLEKITASTEYTAKIKPTLDKLVQTTLTPPTLPVATLPTPRFNSLSGERTLTIEASAVFGRPASGTLAVTGPVRVGTVNWGNGVTAPVFALVTGDQMTVPLRHTYRTSGPYTITLTDLANKSVSRQVVVSASSTGQVRGASTDVYAQMAEALQAMSALLRSLEVK